MYSSLVQRESFKMYCNIFLLFCVITTGYCQFFGGLSNLPGGGFNQQAGYRGSVFSRPNHDVSAWGSLSQSQGRGYSSPITYSGGADWTAPRGGLSGSASHIPGLGTSLTGSGHVNVFKTPDASLNAFASHTKNFDTHFKAIGPGSTSAGLGLDHKSGASLSVTGTHIPGIPNMGSVQGNLPLYQSKDGTARLDANAGVNFGGGQRPNSNVGLKFEKRF